MELSIWAGDRGLETLDIEVIIEPWVLIGSAQGGWYQREYRKDITELRRGQAFRRHAEQQAEKQKMERWEEQHDQGRGNCKNE